jgi:hypothetical protein
MTISLRRYPLIGYVRTLGSRHGRAIVVALRAAGPGFDRLSVEPGQERTAARFAA